MLLSDVRCSRLLPVLFGAVLTGVDVAARVELLQAASVASQAPVFSTPRDTARIEEPGYTSTKADQP